MKVTQLATQQKLSLVAAREMLESWIASTDVRGRLLRIRVQHPDHHRGRSLKASLSKLESLASDAVEGPRAVLTFVPYKWNLKI